MLSKRLALKVGDVGIYHLADFIQHDCALHVRLGWRFAGDACAHLDLELEPQQKVQLLSENRQHVLDHALLDRVAGLAVVLHAGKFDLLAHEFGFEFGEILRRVVLANQVLADERLPRRQVLALAVLVLRRSVGKFGPRVVDRLTRKPELFSQSRRVLDPLAARFRASKIIKCFLFYN